MAGGQQTRSNSGPGAFYGGMTWGVPQRLQRNFLNPLIQGFGYGRRSENFREGMDQHSGPLADYLRQVGSFSGSLLPQSIAMGQNIAEQAPQLYGNLQGQINSALGQLPELQAGAGNISDKAKFLVDQAFDPINSRALFQETIGRATDAARQGQAARGLLEQGTSQQSEQDLSRDLAFQQAQQDFGQQQAALGGYGSALQNQLGFSQAGVPLAQAGMEGLGLLGELQQFGLNLPMSTAGNLFSLLSGGVAPGLQLSQITGPQQYSHSKGGSGNIL